MDALGIADGARVAALPRGRLVHHSLPAGVGPNGVGLRNRRATADAGGGARRVAREGLVNVETRLGSDSNEPAFGSLDAVLVVTRIRKSRIALHSSAISPLPSSLASASAS